jgi:hypothetical protein
MIKRYCSKPGIGILQLSLAHPTEELIRTTAKAIHHSIGTGALDKGANNPTRGRTSARGRLLEGVAEVRPGWRSALISQNGGYQIVPKLSEANLVTPQWRLPGSAKNDRFGQSADEARGWLNRLCFCQQSRETF